MSYAEKPLLNEFIVLSCLVVQRILEQMGLPVICSVLTLHLQMKGLRLWRLYFLPQLTWYFKKKSMSPVFLTSDWELWYLSTWKFSVKIIFNMEIQILFSEKCQITKWKARFLCLLRRLWLFCVCLYPQSSKQCTSVVCKG